MAKIENVVKYVYNEQTGDHIFIDADKVGLLDNVTIFTSKQKNKRPSYYIYNKSTGETTGLITFLFNDLYKRSVITNDFTRSNLKLKPRTSKLKWVYFNKKTGYYNYEIVKNKELFKETGFETETDAASAFNIKMAQLGFTERL